MERFVYRREPTLEKGAIVWNVYREGWYLGKVTRTSAAGTLAPRRAGPYGNEYIWRASFIGWEGWPSRRRMDAAEELWKARAPWEKGPTP